MVVKCDLCAREICKYEQDVNSSDAVQFCCLEDGKWKTICDECARKIAMELIER